MISLSRKCSMAAVFAAALFVMAVVSFAVLMIVMMAGFIRIVLQRSVQIGRDDIVRSAVYAGQKLHACFLQRHPRAHANAAAHIGHGSTVTYRVQSLRCFPPMASVADVRAIISACAVGSLSLSVML